MAIFIYTCHGVEAGEKTIKAKIGIEILSGQTVYRAKSREILKAGDRIRIYVHTREPSNIYVVYTDKNKANLLNMTTQKIGESTLCLPSAHAYYKVDGNSPVERFTVLCSPVELPRISGMDSAGIPWEKWVAIEDRLIKRSKIQLIPDEEDPIVIAGVVRGNKNADDRDRFVAALPTYSGNGRLIKIYEFNVQ
jgi:hypothetical protein